MIEGGSVVWVLTEGLNMETLPHENKIRLGYEAREAVDKLVSLLTNALTEIANRMPNKEVQFGPQ